MTRAILVALAGLLAAAPARAEDPTPVVVEVGKSLDVCKEKLVTCPASSFMCDASNVARLEGGAGDAIELKGIAPGKTLCTVKGFEAGYRRVLSVTVKAAPGSEPKAAAAEGAAPAR
jgi:hypothetical protein